MAHASTVADVLARHCAAHGVQRAFGVPGGGSSLDLIEAFARHGIEFHLCRTETGATLMAAADAEIRNAFGVAIATQGPGAASAMNGLAHASLDRAPVLFISDGWTDAQARFDSHQVFDQRAMSAPVVKASSRLESEDPGAELETLIARMRTPPWGPVHIELTGANARRTSNAPAAAAQAAHSAPPAPPPVRAAAAELLRGARRPVIVAGLELRDAGAAAAALALAERLRCPVLVSYKAKGLISDESDWVVGHFTGGALEQKCVSAADLIVLCGLDPVELIGRPWPYAAPVIDVALARHPVHCVEPAAGLYGGLADNLDALHAAGRASQWTLAEIEALRRQMREQLACPAAGARGLSPQAVVQIAMEAAAPQRPAITVDAGAHMFSAMGFWQAREAGAALISNGLATMGFALPAGIARALNSPGRPTLAFTGDGGLMMCAGELATAAQCKARLCVVVFNDGALSLIALKQHNRGMASAGVGWERADFAAVARGFGWQASSVRDADGYRDALRQALAAGGPCLIDVRVDPSGYRAQAKALRG